MVQRCVFRPATRRRLLFGTLGLAAGAAHAGGLMLYEIGSADLGLASAGRAARAQDAATVANNPAGMVRLDGDQIGAGLQLIRGNLEFSRGAGNTVSGGDGGDPIGWFPGASGFYSHSVSDRLKLGVGLYGNFGAALNYRNDWAGRYIVDQGTLLGVTLQPSVAYRVDEHLSFGAGLVAMYGILKDSVAINNRPFGALPDVADGKLELDDNRWGFGANLGVLYELSPATRFGLAWTSEIDLDFEARADFSGLGPGLQALLARRGLLDAKIDLGVTVPQTVTASVYHQLDERLALLGSLGWQQWSKFGQVEVGVASNDPRSLTTDLDFDDTWQIALGAQYKLSTPWQLSFGVAYDSSFQDEDDVSPLLPAGSAWRFAAGAEYAASKDLRYGFGVEYLYGGTLDVDKRGPVRGDLVGSYDDSGTFFMAAYANWRF